MFLASQVILALFLLATKPAENSAAKPQRPSASPAASKPTRPAKQPSTAPTRPKPPAAAAAAAATDQPAKMKKIPGKPATRPAKKEKLVDKSSNLEQNKPKVQSVDLLGSIEDSVVNVEQSQPPPAANCEDEEAAVDLLAGASSQAGPSNLDLLMGTAQVEIGFRGKWSAY